MKKTYVCARCGESWTLDAELHQRVSERWRARCPSCPDDVSPETRQRAAIAAVKASIDAAGPERGG